METQDVQASGATATGVPPSVTSSVPKAKGGKGRTLRPRRSKETSEATSGQQGDNRPVTGAKATRKKATKRAPRVTGNPAENDTAIMVGGSAAMTMESVGEPSRVPQPIFTFVSAPKVTDMSHEALTKWRDLRTEYEEAIKARCKTTGEKVEAVMVSVRHSFDESLLETLCEVKWDISRDDLSEQFLVSKIDETLHNFKNKILPDIEELFRRELMW